MTTSGSIERLLRRYLTAGCLLMVLGCGDAALDDSSKRLGVVFPIQHGRRWGAIDGSGTVIVEPAYDNVSYGFSTRSANGAHQLIGQQGVLLTSASAWCFVTADGAHRIKPIREDYWRVFNLGESLFAVEKQPSDRGYTADTRPPWVFQAAVHPFKVYDPFKKWNPPHGVFPVNRLSEGLLAVVGDGKFGFADRNGKVVVPTKYEAAYAFSDGLAAVMLDSKWGFINSTGKLVIEPQFDRTGDFDQGLAMVAQDDRDKPFFINKQGEEVSEWPFAFNFGTTYGLFSEGLWSRSDPTTKLRGFVNSAGEWAIAPAFKTAQPFSDGLATVEFADSGEFRYIDRTGELRFSIPRASHLSTFGYGLAWVTRTGSAPHAGYINRDGEWVWQGSP